MKKKNIAIVLGVMCLMLTMAIAVQYRTIQSTSKIVGNAKNSELKTEVLKWKEKYDIANQQLKESEEILESQRDLSTGNNKESTETQAKLKKLNSIIGTIDVKGQGIVITIADNKEITNDNIGTYDNISNYLIHDRDLLSIVNELKNAGAEAISINEERIVNTTAITCDGNVILVNGNKLSSPFEIKAIGSQETLMGAIERPGGFIENEMKPYGLLVDVKKEKNIIIYRYNGVVE